MNGNECQRIRDLLPEWDLDDRREDGRREEGDLVAAHLRTCVECQRELEVIKSVRDQRPTVPPELEERIQARVRQDLGKERGPSGLPFVRRRWAPTWALSAAAVVILALGTSIIWNGGDGETVQDPTAVASQELLPESWLWDDGMVAGAPVFDGLSDEDLETLLEELEG